MRPIKFRAWDKKWLSMATFEEMQSRQHKALNVTDSSQFILLPFHENVTLMQFTGLHDKNGKEIYEGDILRVSNVSPTRCSSVTWSKKHYGFQCLGSNGNNYGISANDEIIGNIYENPELLKA